MLDYENIDNILNKDDFADFLKKFRGNLLKSPDEWENNTLDNFLEAMEAWIRDMDGYIANSGDEGVKVASWRTFAKILQAARVYE